MKLIPMLFSTPMVQAERDGRKTKTRRILKAEHVLYQLDVNNHKPSYFDNSDWCPYGQACDIIWVRETFYAYGMWVQDEGVFTKFGKQAMKFIDFTNENGSGWQYCFEDSKPLRVRKGRTEDIGWYKRPAIHMPYTACRTWLKIKSIRVERLQEISEADAIAEGVQENKCEDIWACPSSFCKTEGCSGSGQYFHYSSPMDFDLEPCYSAVESFQTLWKMINGEESYKANPWVWVIEFERTEKP